jgi:guanylate kinase
MKRSRGVLLVVSAPSGCGKTTILNRVMAAMPDLVFSISHTTRAPRPGEADGREYHFDDQQRFVTLREQGGFLEWAEVHGNLYGTGRAEVEAMLAKGQDVVLDIDVQGAFQVMEAASPVTVFIAPPSLAALEQRLRGRATEDEASIRLRLDNAKAEMAVAHRYQYLIINDQLEVAIDQLRCILVAERLRQQAKELECP